MKKNNLYTYISIDEMLKAKTDDAMMTSILERIDLFIRNIANTAYYYYGGRHDPALTIDDFISFCKFNIVKGIKLYYHPERYDPKKDISGRYKNGFHFIRRITQLYIKQFHNFTRKRKKRIPPEKYISLDFLINENTDNECNMGNFIKVIDKDKHGVFLNEILNRSNKLNKDKQKVIEYLINNTNENISKDTIKKVLLSEKFKKKDLK